MNIFLKYGLIFKVTRLKIRKKAYIRKSVAQIGSVILLILTHAGITATTDPALVVINFTVKFEFDQQSVLGVKILEKKMLMDRQRDGRHINLNGRLVSHKIMFLCI